MSAEDENRVAYLAGEPVESLSAEERAELDELRDLLRAPSAWAEPAPDLEDRVVATISAQAGTRPAATRPRRGAEPERDRDDVPVVPAADERAHAH